MTHGTPIHHPPVRQPPVIEASGTHREVGRQIGEAARDLVAQGLAAYEQRFSVLAGFGFAEAIERARAYLRPAEDYVPQAVDQIRGIAEGAAVPFERLFALNCGEEFTCEADRVWPRPEHCTSFAVVAGGRVVSGHNEDWFPDDVANLVVRNVRLSGPGPWAGAAYISIGPAYDLPITGITSGEFTSAANTVYFRDERIGVPNNCLLATVLEQSGLDAARDLIAASPRARGSNHLLCDAAGRVWDVETTGERVAFMDGGTLLTHTNHYVSPELSPEDASASEGSRLRRARAEEMLVAGVASGADLVELGKSLLSDHANRPFSICAHWNDDDPDEDQDVTTASMVWEPAEGRAHIACGQPCVAPYMTYQL
jgi:isopenicillin-N N-acyltransferase-like protein